jgi:formamidopyrimidine-DNA glycosylase
LPEVERRQRSLQLVPELPEVEITARRLDTALKGARIESALAPGINALKTFDPSLSALEGRAIAGVRRIGKNIVIDVSGDLVLLVHLMSAGRMQLFDKRAGPRDRTSRLLVRIEGGRELRLREFGTKQAAWVKLLRADELEADEMLTKLGPEAWPQPPANLGELLDAPRPLHGMLRDQRIIAGIGRSWVVIRRCRRSVSNVASSAKALSEATHTLRASSTSSSYTPTGQRRELRLVDSAGR